jgi:methylated-DNA-[protein]-cysteine S-methyltransferase
MITSDREILLADLTAGETQEASRLHATLVAAAAERNLLDVAYRTVDTPVGQLLLAATEQGLVRLAYATEGHDEVLQGLAVRISPRVLHAPDRLDPVVRELEEYFAGRRRRFTVPLDLRLARGYRRDVLRHLIGIGYGQTQTYAAVAAATDHPRAVRAVGSACATNPIPVLVPCHRVLRSDGSLGGYLGGLSVKQSLLKLESGVRFTL